MFEAHFQTFEEPEAGVALRRGWPRCVKNSPAAARRLRRSARRPASERIRARLRGAAGLADRLHRLGRDGGRAAARGRAVRRRPLHAAGGASRSTHGCSRSSRWSIRRRRAGSSRTCQPATASATTRGCTPPTAPSGSPTPAPRPARRSCRSSAIRSTRSGPTGRRRRSGRSCCTICDSPAKPRPSKLDADPRRDRQAPRRRAGGLRPARRGLDLQHPRLRRRAHAAAARLRDRAEGGPADALHRRAQALQRGARQSRSSRRRARARRAVADARRRSAQARRTVRLDQATAADALAASSRAPAARRCAASIRSR